MKKYSTQIYKIRKLEGLSQEEFGNKIGVSRQMVSKWEMGISSPRTDKINTICTVFGIKPEEFLKDEEENEEDKKITKIIYNNKKKKLSKEKEHRKKARKIIVLIISAVLTIYILCSICKFIYIKSRSKKNLKYKDINNYYFTLTTYIEGKAVEREDVWYLDGKYKIEKTYTNYEKNINDQKNIYYIDTKNNTEEEYIMKNSETKQEIKNYFNDKITYKDGKLLNSSFPTMLVKSNEEITKNYFKFGFINIINSKENKGIIINNNEITLDQETGIKIKNKITNNNNLETSQIISLETESNCIKDEDIKGIYEK